MTATPLPSGQITHGKRPPQSALVVVTVVTMLLIAAALPIPLRAATPNTNSTVVSDATREWLADVPAKVSFRRDVQAVLSKAGCNMGLCHGNQAGKGGFFLALRGQDAAADYRSIVDDLSGRRVNRVSPEDSLLLLKPTAQVPHVGGQRFAPGSLEYETLRRWIADGMPDDGPSTAMVDALEVTPTDAVVFTDGEPSIQLRVVARFADGTQRDVTKWAVYESTSLTASVDRVGHVARIADGETTIMVRYLNRQSSARVAFVPRRELASSALRPMANLIDDHIASKLKRLGIPPAALCDDAAFVRRAYLDTLGLLPTPTEAQAFITSTDPDRRARLIDQLLARPEFAEHWALKWSDVLRNEEKVLDTRGVDAFHGWIRSSFAQGKPLDQFAAELVSSLGSTYENPPTNFYRAHRDPTARSVAVARVLLGYRLQCAECHNHPYDTWTQADFYDWAAVFANIGYEIKDNKRRDEFDKHEFVGEQIVHDHEDDKVMNPRTRQQAQPRLLGSGEQLSGDRPKLQQLAEWLTSPDNRSFARAQVNRIWFHLMGRGLVDPVDDFRVTNPPSHPELLERLTDEFIQSHYDPRHLIRIIMQSSAYQASVGPGTDSIEVVNYAHAQARRLTAEQLLDAQSQVLGATIEFVGYPAGTRAGQMTGVQRVRPRDKRPAAGDRLLKMFGKPDRLLACECERTQETHLGQALALMAGEGLHEILVAPANRIGKQLDAAAEPSAIVRDLYWWALSRDPSSAELDAARRVIDSDNSREGLEDVAWALVTSREFLFRP